MAASGMQGACLGQHCLRGVEAKPSARAASPRAARLLQTPAYAHRLPSHVLLRPTTSGLYEELLAAIGVHTRILTWDQLQVGLPLRGRAAYPACGASRLLLLRPWRLVCQLHPTCWPPGSCARLSGAAAPLTTSMRTQLSTLSPCLMTPPPRAGAGGDWRGRPGQGAQPALQRLQRLHAVAARACCITCAKPPDTHGAATAQHHLHACQLHCRSSTQVKLARLTPDGGRLVVVKTPGGSMFSPGGTDPSNDAYLAASEIW